MRLPGPRDIDELAHPTWGRAALGALAAAGVFAGATTAVITVATSISFALTSVSPAVDALGAVIATAFFALVVSAIIAGVISLSWGLLTAMLMGTALARVRAWPVHAVSYFLLGAVTPLLAVFLLFHGADVLNPFMIATMAASGVAVLVGWSVAWRSAVRARARLVLAAE